MKKNMNYIYILRFIKRRDKLVSRINKILSISFLLIMSFALLLFACGCSNNQETDVASNFENVLAEETADATKYENMAYIGDWFLGSINSGETDDNGYIWDTPEYLETLTINPSGLIVDSIEDDSLEGYIVPEEISTEETEDADKSYSETNFKAIFAYEYEEGNVQEIEIYFVYIEEKDCLVVMYDEDIVSCVYYRGELQNITQLEDGTYVDSEGNPIDVSEEDITINNKEE